MHPLLKRLTWSLHTVGLFLRNPRDPWRAESNFDDRWKRRIQKMATYIDSAGEVADFGCGMMWLKEFLPLGNRYIPIDCVSRSKDTIVRDLNRDGLPTTNAEFAFFSGILEYIEDLPGFMQRVADQGFRRIILSYCVTETHANRWIRHSLTWKSHASTAQLLRLTLQHGYVLTALDEMDNNTIFVFDATKQRPSLPVAPSSL
jgi:hypothetical protein